MSRVNWDAMADRKFESGLDRGVLYPLGEDGYIPGVAWNGLIGVDEKSDGEGLKSYYYDGVKYASIASGTEFKASISAVTYPSEFESCVGVEEMSPGVFVTQQNSKMFGICYRTLSGNALQGLEYGYKLHLVYGAMALPPSKGYSTLSESVTFTPFSWDIETVPVDVSGFRPMAHLVIDSTDISDYKLAALEDILYGTDDTASRLPLPDEIRDIVALGDRFIIVLDDDDTSLLPPDYIDGDLAISIDDEEGYVVDTDSDPNISDDVRPVIELEDEDEPLPDYALVGDIIYIKSTGFIYRLGE